MNSETSPPTKGPKLIFEAIKKAGITTVASLPERKLWELIDLVDKDNSFRHVSLCREEEGVGICAGAYMTGAKPAIIMQNGGLLNSVNALTTTALHLQIPLLLLIYYAGDVGDRGFSTVGSVTEGVLQGLGIRYQVLRKIEEIESTIIGAWTLAEDSSRPVAVLLTRSVLLK
jgi:sulfopyruvate decarboxylase subunit alpha